MQFDVFAGGLVHMISVVGLLLPPKKHVQADGGKGVGSIQKKSPDYHVYVLHMWIDPCEAHFYMLRNDLVCLEDPPLKLRSELANCRN